MINFDNSYARLPIAFYDKHLVLNQHRPTLLALNHDLAQELGIDLTSDSTSIWLNYFCANEWITGSDPLAMAYAGHQFGHFVPQLGDGRALLLGECLAPSGVRYDIHLKGSGRTKFSRAGDGKSALGPVVREYLMSEFFHALGIPTTRSLCALRTGEDVYRDKMKPGGILVRVAKGHIRIGTFEYFACRGDKQNLKVLADYCIDRFYPELSESKEKYFDFWMAVAARQLKLVADWMSYGFIHGVMNTDNVSISGETIDFGPCAFMDEFKRDKVFSFIDRHGRYAYQAQPKIMLWNLARLSEAIAMMFDENEEQPIFLSKVSAELKLLPQRFDDDYIKVMLRKLGLANETQEGRVLLNGWLDFLERHQLDFTLSFYDLIRVLEKKQTNGGLERFLDFSAWHACWLACLKQQSRMENSIDSIQMMRQFNPLTIARNHQLEKVIERCELGDDDLFYTFLAAIQRPFLNQQSESEVLSEFQMPPTIDERIRNTFCGT
jgi:uncharacterized protein YdiU (UPF0061 family)